MTEIQGIDIIVQVREVGDTEWLKMVCEIDSQFQHTNDTTDTDTKCGTFYGIKQMKGNYSGNAVFNVDPDADEVSYNDVLNWQKNKTQLEILIKNAAYVAEDGSNIAESSVVHIFAPGRFTDTTLTGATGEVGKFSWTFKPTGLPTLSGASA